MSNVPLYQIANLKMTFIISSSLNSFFPLHSNTGNDVKAEHGEI